MREREHEIIRKRYRIPREISVCIVNDPRLLCFTCRKVRCTLNLTLCFEVVRRILRYICRVIFYATPLGNHRRIEGNFLRAQLQFYFSTEEKSLSLMKTNVLTAIFIFKTLEWKYT